MAHRQAISSIRTGLQSKSRQPLHTSTSSRSAMVVQSPTFQEPETITLPPIFDIFDVPAQLGESSRRLGLQREADIDDASRPLRGTSPSPFSPSVDSLSFPTSLPPPIVFDGPAQPRNPALASRSRRRLRPTTPPNATTTRQHHTPSVPFSTSEPLVQLFDGPARITRYRHQPSSRKNNGYATRQVILLGLAGGLGFATYNQTQKSDAVE
ncbi:hypothetical protein BDN72DRAFT_446136 [Pluteus cervinus]|uniref:Uncharacterized protein n=1 Tax=Pluteus cervinus TaxID=181527 RepID=A0ACD3BCZ6_9AGAR|nr:hypothetical protein BDN72DRAFT_446136 [Pluteus cervinus]